MDFDDKIDFSCLDPSSDEGRWEKLIAETAEQARLLRDQHNRGGSLNGLDVFASERDVEPTIQAVVRSALGFTPSSVSRRADLQNQVTTVAPHALVAGAILAAATWLGVFWIGAQRVQDDPTLCSPGLNLAMWAVEDRVPQTEEILLMMGDARGER